jgi:hypothetical protein
MSKNINVNPGHYKVAGRERQGENVVHEIEKHAVKRHRDRKRARVAEPPTKAEQSSRSAPAGRQGPVAISNRLSPESEARMLEEHPPVDVGSPPPEDAAGRVGEQPLEDRRDRQTSHKADSRSIAQKEAAVRYPDRSMPASRKVAGAFGREPRERAAGSPAAKPAARRRRTR